MLIAPTLRDPDEETDLLPEQESLELPSASTDALEGSLRSYVLGSWELESYVELAEDGSVSDRPFGEDAGGLLIYADDGFMSAFLMPAGRRPFASGDWFSPTREELAEASRIIAYSGRYLVDEVAGTVTHQVALSFFPNWSGQDQVRRVERLPGRLVLTPDKPLHSGGRMTWPQLTWARPSAGLVPAGLLPVSSVTPARRSAA